MNDIEKVIQQFTLREAFIVACAGAAGTSAQKFANSKYPAPEVNEAGELPEIEEANRVSVYSQNLDKFVPYEDFHDEAF